MGKSVRSDRPLNPWGQRGYRRRVGLLGGSFNPAHEGHAHIALEALRRLSLDEVWFLVSPQNPLKNPRESAPFCQRLAGAARLAGQDRRLRATDLEFSLGTCRTLDTVRFLRRRYPQTAFVWLMGADNLVQIPRWFGWRMLFRLIPVAVFARAPYTHTALRGRAGESFASSRLAPCRAPALANDPPPAWVYLPIRLHEASSTALRKAANGIGMVP